MSLFESRQPAINRPYYNHFPDCCPVNTHANIQAMGLYGRLLANFFRLLNMSNKPLYIRHVTSPDSFIHTRWAAGYAPENEHVTFSTVFSCILRVPGSIFGCMSEGNSETQDNSHVLNDWLVVFNIPSTARSFRDGTPIYCHLAKDVKLDKYTVPTGN